MKNATKNATKKKPVKGPSVHERTLRMKENYVRLFDEEGLPPSEIAKHFGLSVNTVYNHLDEIAKANNRSRDSLLSVVHDEHIMSAKNYKPLEPFDIKKMTEVANSAKESTDKLVATMLENSARIDASFEEIERKWSEK